jgi:magnesium-transporting ATPase (P-type)
MGFLFWFKYKPDYADGILNMEYIFYSRTSKDDSVILEICRIFTAYFTIFNTLIPISIMITMEVVKGIQVIMLDKEPGLRDRPDDKLKILSMKLQEDLGCIKYIFTDKTGTLTRNEMEFKACTIFTRLFDEEKALDQDIHFKKSIFSRTFDIQNLCEALRNEIPITIEGSPFPSMNIAILEYLLNIAINHNVLTEEDPETKEKTYTGSSPDEVVLVQAAKELGIEFIERVGKFTKVKVFDDIQTFEVLHRFEYSSTRMRSSIIVKDSSGSIKLYMKGADTIILKRVNEYSQQKIFPQTKEHLEKFAKDGLRTLCFSMKILTEQELNEWEIGYREIHHMAIQDKKCIKELEQKISDIETNTLLLGVSGLEDKLQEDVKKVLQEFIEAGINCWMLTGDKLDTAESIGYSCKLFNDDTEVFKIKANDNKQNVLEQIKKIIFQMQDIEEEMLMFQITKSVKKDSRVFNKSNIEFEKTKKFVENRLEHKKTSEPIENIKINKPPLGKVDKTFVRKKTHVFESRPKAIDDLQFIGTEDDPNNKERLAIKFKIDSRKNVTKFEPNEEPSREIVDDVDIIKYMVDKQVFEENKNNLTFLKQLAKEHEDSMFKNNLRGETKDEDDKEFDFGNLYNHYKKQVNNLDKRKGLFDFTFKNFGQVVNKTEHEYFTMNFGIIVEGSAISLCLDKEISPYFWQILKKSRSVICCRCSPLQKAEVVKFIKKKSKAMTLAIGDGGNDINMIKQANIGVGIFGKEGYQAAFNSDYAISQFKFLRNLLFIQGRYHLLRNAYFVCFYFYKNLIYSFPQFWFTFFNGFSGSLLWDDWYYLGYNSFISTLPVAAYMLLEEDIDIRFEGASDQSMLEW